jgi:MFS family permease
MHCFLWSFTRKGRKCDMKVSTQPVRTQGVAVPTAHLQRNFWLGVLSGIGYNLYLVFFSTELILAWFLTELTDSNLLISLLIPVEMGSWYFLQIVFSGYVERKPLTMPVYRVTAGIRVAALGLLAVAAFTVTDPQALIVAFFLLFVTNALMAGVAALPFMNIVAKTIPSDRRGAYFGWRRFAGGLLGLGAGVLVRAILAPETGLTFSGSFGWLFVLTTVVTLLQVVTFSLVIEPHEAVDTRRVPLKEQFGRALTLPIRDGNFGRYLGTRVAIVAAALALPFYTVYARRVLAAPEETVGIYLMGMTLAGVLSNLAFARLSDRWGNRLVVRLAALMAMLVPATALLVAFAPGLGPARVAVFGLVYVLQGIQVSARVIGGTNYLLELTPSIERVLYIGVAHGVLGVVFFMSPLGAAIVDSLGFVPLFVVALAAGLVAIIVSLTLDEPRRRLLPVEAEAASV